MVERRGFEDLVCGVKRVSVTLVRKGTKRKEKNITLLACPQMRQWWQQDLRGLRGDAWWRGGGLKTGKRGLCNGQKRNEKEEKKNITLLACP